MLEYDYLMQRDEGDKTVEYAPRSYPRRLPTLAILQGPNSSGKSTLLNLIALGFFGLSQKRIDQSLRNKMAGLLDSSYQQLTFNVTVASEDGTTVLNAVKQSGRAADILVTEDVQGRKATLSSETFSS